MANISVSDMVNRAITVKNGIRNVIENFGEDMTNVPFASYPAKIQSVIENKGGGKLSVVITSPTEQQEINLPITVSWSVSGYNANTNVTSIVVIDNKHAIVVGDARTLEISEFTENVNEHSVYVIAINNNKCGISNVKSIVVKQ